MIKFKPYVVAGTVSADIYPTSQGGNLSEEDSRRAFHVARTLAYHPEIRANAGICMPHHFPGLMHISEEALPGFLSAMKEAGVPADEKEAMESLSLSGVRPSYDD